MQDTIHKAIQKFGPFLPDSESARRLAEAIFSELVRDGWALPQYQHEGGE